MSLLSPEFNNLSDLFIQQLEDIYDAELRLVEALPEMEKTASTTDLKTAFREHCDQTRIHAKRLEDIFRSMGKEPERDTCKAMKGLIEEGDEMASAKGDDLVRDAGLIAAAQRVEHYEIAVYGTLRSFAEQLGMLETAHTLQETLDEEDRADKLLTAIAESKINALAAH